MVPICYVSFHRLWLQKKAELIITLVTSSLFGIHGHVCPTYLMYNICSNLTHPQISLWPGDRWHSFSPILESFGRKPLYMVSMLLFSGFCIIVATTPCVKGVVIRRFFMGLVSAIRFAGVTGSVEGIYGPKIRVWMIFAWSVFVNIDHAFGPIYGPYITQNLGWFVFMPRNYSFIDNEAGDGHS